MVRMVDFMIDVLRAHGQTLQRLAAFYGEDELLEMLETIGDQSFPQVDSIEMAPEWFETEEKLTDGGGKDKADPVKMQAQAYAELEWAVRELKLPPTLEFHLWAYPFYRSLIESSIDLSRSLRTSDTGAGPILIEKAITFAKVWIQALPIPPEQSQQTEQLAWNSWLRFRSEAMKKFKAQPVVRL